jgi:hypothetical protein
VYRKVCRLGLWDSDLAEVLEDVSSELGVPTLLSAAPLRYTEIVLEHYIAPNIFYQVLRLMRAPLKKQQPHIR